VFTKAVLDDARSIFMPVCADFGAEHVELDDGEGRAHPVVNNPPRMAISKLV
jgi:REP element-mobilizing transposase RayT